MTRDQKRDLTLILLAAVLLAGLLAAEHLGYLDALPRWGVLGLYLLPYLLVGWEIVANAVRNLFHGQVFDENLLMTVATAAAFGVSEYAEAVAVMLLYQVGELFQSYAVGRSRKSIAAMMDIAPEYANLELGGVLTQVDPDEVPVGSVIAIKPGERVPLDGIVLEGSSFLDTAALTGESVPRRVGVGDAIISGCVNGSGTLRVEVTKVYEDSTVTRILELVENAASKKARTERFITRFARVYTPLVTLGAIVLALLPPLLFGGDWGTWIRRACVFLVVSCPCALVISVPMGFFGGIGAASRLGVLVKGGNHLEAVSKLRTLVFDKTGTLTRGEFKVSGLFPEGVSAQELLELAALGEGFSTHPIAASIREAYGELLPLSRVGSAEELAGRGIRAEIDGRAILLGSAKLMDEYHVPFTPHESGGTVVYLARDGAFLGSVEISDTVKPGAQEAITALRASGVSRCVMLTGDRAAAAKTVADELGLDGFRAELLPGGKVAAVEELLAKKDGTLGFVGDGLNDAPVLSIADVGVAMGSLGSDAAIEAADVVIMDDDLRKLAACVGAARKTMRIVRQNVAFALGVKLVIMALGVFGLADMWLAVFGDVGVSILAILNSMRALRTK